MSVERIGILCSGKSKFKDNAYLNFGNGNDANDPALYDVEVYWDGTQLVFLPLANNTVVAHGDGALSMDQKWFGSAAASYLLWDASANTLSTEGVLGVLRIGTFVSAGVGGTALSASKTAAARFYADDGNASIVTGNHVRTTVNRFLLLAATGADVTAEGAQNQLKIATATPTTTSYLAGAYDYLEIAAAASIACHAAPVRAEVDAGSNNITVAAGGVLAAVLAECKFNGTLTETGIIAAMYVGKNSGGSAAQWPQAMYVGAADRLVKFATGTAYECGVKVASITSVGGAVHAADGVIKVDVAGTAYYIPIYAAASLVGE